MSRTQNGISDTTNSTVDSVIVTNNLEMGSHESKDTKETTSLSTGSLCAAAITTNEEDNSKSHLIEAISDNSLFIDNAYRNNDDDSASESLPPAEERLEETHDRSDGSDSGLGSEISEEGRLDNIVAPPVESDTENFFLEKHSMSAEVIDSQILSTNNTPPTSVMSPNQKPSRSSLKRKISGDLDERVPKCKKKRGITFDNVTVFYFPRTQGFTCVPSQGGSTLGMGAKHAYIRKFSIIEHANEQRRVHRQLLQRLRSEHQNVRTTTSSSEDSESEEEVTDGTDSEMDLDSCYFLQPVPTRQRRALLRSAGVRKIDSIEKDECRDIRSSREFCGCGCKGYCDPDTCSCSQAGIKCQVDRLNFPCGCSRDNCGNLSGRTEFNPVRVRTHFIHTLMRLELEKKQSEPELRDEKADRHPNDNWVGARLSEFTNADKFSGGLLKDVTLNSNMEVESCVHNGNFTNLHYGAPGEGPGIVPHANQNFTNLPAREDSLDLYAFREDCYQEAINQEVSPERKIQHRSFSTNLGFQFLDGRFSENNFQGSASSYPTTSSQYPQHYHSSFGDFPPVFNPYGNMYGSEFGTKTFDPNFQQTNCYEQFPPTESDNFAINESKDTQYTSLNPVGANNKIESFSDLLNGRYTYGAYEDSTAFASVNTSDVAPNDAEKHNCIISSTSQTADDCDENFGEIIKKSMVETVSA